MIIVEDGLENKNELNELLKKQGYFFQRAVYQEIKKLTDRCESEYPFSLSNFIDSEKIPRTIDIYAILKLKDSSVRFVIECKKAYNPGVNFIFFSEGRINFSAWNRNYNQPIPGGHMDYYEDFPYLNRAAIFANSEIVIRKKDKGKNQELTIESPGRIYKASRQVSSALYGIKANEKEEYEYLELEGRVVKFWYIPMVVTNCEINSCDFQTVKQTIANGSIPDGKIKWEKVPWLIYNYPLPQYLHIQEDYKHDDATHAIFGSPWIRKLPILFINSESIKNFFELFKNYDLRSQ